MNEHDNYQLEYERVELDELLLQYSLDETHLRELFFD